MMGLGDGGRWDYWVDRWICCVVGYVAAGYGCRHFVAVSVSGSVEIQRDTHVGLQSGKTFCR